MKKSISTTGKHRIVIVGGSHSAFSAAWMCLNKLNSSTRYDEKEEEKEKDKERDKVKEKEKEEEKEEGKEKDKEMDKDKERFREKELEIKKEKNEEINKEKEIKKRVKNGINTIMGSNGNDVILCDKNDNSISDVINSIPNKHDISGSFNLSSSSIEKNRLVDGRLSVIENGFGPTDQLSSEFNATLFKGSDSIITSEKEEEREIEKEREKEIKVDKDIEKEKVKEHGKEKENEKTTMCSSSSSSCMSDSINNNTSIVNSIVILHRSAIKVFYSMKKEADIDNYYDIGVMNKTTGQIHPFGGLRGDSKILWRFHLFLLFCLSVCVALSLSVSVCLSVCMWMYISDNHAYIYIHEYIHICVYILICVYDYIHACGCVGVFARKYFLQSTRMGGCHKRNSNN